MRRNRNTHHAAGAWRAPLLAMALLTAAAALASPAHAAPEDAAYRTADANGDGTLNRGEFRTFIDLLAKDGLPIARRVRFWKVYGMAFRMTDKDGNGELSPAELRRSERENRNRKRP